MKSFWFLLLAVVAAAGAAREQDEVTLLRWAGPEGSRPETFEEWIAEHPYTERCEFRLVHAAPGRDRGTVAIVTEQSLAAGIATELGQYVSDVQAEGYSVLSYTMAGGTPDSLRSFLRNLYNGSSIEGALLIGNLPVPYFQIRNDFNTYGYASWPIDLFYMDLNGLWYDTLRRVSGDSWVSGPDGLYDAHGGDQYAEIHVGRLLPTGLGTFTDLIKNYFRKNHAFRRDLTVLPERALVFVDDDWYPWAQSWANNVAALYSDTLVFRDSEATRALNYRPELNTQRGWVSVFAHSSPSLHQFYYNHHRSTDVYSASEYTTQNPPSHFYNHFACSFCRYTSSGYGGGRSIFNAGYGLGAIGSTKTGSMLEFNYFYNPLAQGMSLGQAFRDWFNRIIQGGVTFNELCWHYGMTLLGDPFLCPTRRPDIAVRAILSPAGAVDSGCTVQPRARIRNSGNWRASAKVYFRIGASYADSQYVADLAAGDSIVVNFADWIAGPRGSYTARCTAALAGDIVPGNNALSAAVRVIVRDVGVSRIIAPGSLVDSGQTLMPACSVFNAGTETVSYPLRLRIGPDYDETVIVDGHLPGTARGMALPQASGQWPRGMLAVFAATELATDLQPGNDELTCSTFVRVRDAEAAAVLQPSGAVDSGATITPRARVRNPGNSTESFAVRLKSGAGYTAQADVANLAPGDSVVVGFSDWTALSRGFSVFTCSTMLSGDANSGNNACPGSADVQVHDLAVIEILAPGGIVPPGATAPEVRVRNFGTGREPAGLRLRIGTGYDETVDLAEGLPPGIDTLVRFPIWLAAAGDYAVRCSCGLATEQVPVNDTMSALCFVRYSDTGWTQLAGVPAGTRGRAVKDGGSLAYQPQAASHKPQAQGQAQAPSSGEDPACAEGLSSGFVYALKGNGTCEFYCYDITGNSWTALDSIPAVGSLGKKKTVKKGASLAAVSGRLYALKGGNTREFWCYDPMAAGHKWRQLPDVPAGQRNVREGSGLAGLGDHVYLLKGSGTREFYRYGIESGLWETMAEAPAGNSGKVYKNGSCLARDAEGQTYYVLKGSYHEFHAYSVDSIRWTTLLPLPITGSAGRKKVKAGAGLAGFDDAVFALKGGNTREFWGFDPVSETWTELENMPLAGGKKVKGGGALVAADNALYGLKGNSTFEFFRYRPARANRTPPAADRRNAQGGCKPQAAGFKLEVFPNPFSGAATISYSLPRPGPVSLKLYDVTGKLVAFLVCGNRPAGIHPFSVHPRSPAFALAPGSYLLRLETRNSQLGTLVLTRRLVVE